MDSNNAVTATSGSPYAVSGFAVGFALNNSMLAVSMNNGAGAGQITTYSVDANGTPTMLATTTTNDEFYEVFDPTGKFLYLAGTNGVSGYSVDTSSGMLTQLSGSPWGGASPGGWSIPTVTPDDSQVCALAIGPRGNEIINCFQRNGDGTLNSSSVRSVVSSDQNPCRYALSSTGAYVIWSGCANTVNATPINGTAPISSLSSGGSGVEGVAVSGPWVVVANQTSKNITVFKISDSGQLSLVNSLSTSGSPAVPAFSKNGNYLFVTSDAGLMSFSFNTSTGVATQLNGPTTSDNINSEIAAQ